MLPHGIEGQIRVRVAIERDRITQVTLESTRLVHASRVLQGRPVDEALKLLPLLFSVCGTAQAQAGLMACEQALGIVVDAAQQAARELMVLSESAYEHLGRMLLDWSVLRGESVDRTALAGLRGGRAGFRAALFQGKDGYALGGSELRPEAYDLTSVAIAALERLLAETMFGMSVQAWHALDSQEALEKWASRRITTAGRLLSDVLGAGWAGLGRCAVEAMPGIPLQAWERVLAADRSGEFVAAPTWQGRVYETGPLTRELSRPLVSNLYARYGNGLLTRLVARLTELAAIPTRMRELQAALSGHPQPRDPLGKRRDPGYEAGVGIGIIEAARGRLVHRVEVAAGRVTRYQILAPTEWNFHPRGALVQGLAGTPVEGLDDLYRQVRLVVGALDPCVAYELEVVGHA
jgi:hypothetical protein